MALLGQASGGWTESRSALRILNLGIANSVGVLCDDAFTQTNPPIVNDSDTFSANVPRHVIGVLSGSVAFTRGDAGNNMIGGPDAAGEGSPLGLFINDANGYAYENTPGPASGKGPYVCGLGTYGSQIFETQQLGAGGADLTYSAGDRLYASKNGYLTNHKNDDSTHEIAAEATLIGIVKMVPDATMAEIVLDLRV